VVSFTFQTDSTAANNKYKIAVITQQTSATAYSVNFNDFSVGPTAVINGTPVTDWQSYTPTFTNLGVVTGTDFKWRRVGNVLEIIGYGKSATVASNQRFTLPAGLNIDTSVSGVSATNTLGFFNRLPAAAGSTVTTGGLFYDSALGTQVLRLQTRSDTGLYETTATSAISNNEGFSCRAFVPVQGWSSNVQISSDTDTRVVVMGAYGATTTVNNSGVNVIYPTVRMDSHAGYNPSTGVYTVPVSGYYRVSGGFTTLPAAWVNNNAIQMSASITGAGAPGGTFAFTRIISAGTTEQGISGSATYYCAAGDTIVLRVLSGQTVALNGGTNNFVSIERLSGPSVIAASESINARYFSSSTAISGTFATVTYATKDFDSHSSYSGGTYTIPVSGKYQINAALSIIFSSSSNPESRIAIFKNGTQVTDHLSFMGAAAQSSTPSNLVSDIINCLAGDLITIRASAAGTSPSIRSSNFYNYFSISRVGN
jgi:hypothetical protein